MLPAALTALLVGMLALQVALVPTDEPELDAARRAGASAPIVVPPIMPMVASRAILDQPIFTPARANGGGTAADPFAGAQVAGAWSVGRQVNLVMRQANGTSRTLHIGQSVNQWVLTAVTPQGARFSRAGQSMLVPFGATAPQNAPTQQEDENQ
jgi:hypothetical protein